ncbi:MULTISPECIES: copper resistance protein CopC [Paracoccaceae]|jgi:methionine-rich copper-binding protein CopC|uniref:copper resistance CopC family protein n=2 Tax=Alphaproteobacteria TaxID=28211 RepID=UPI003298301E
MMKQSILAGLMMAVLATGAIAHSKAEDTTPANEAIVTTVEAIEMRFDDPMRVTAITVTGPDGDVAIERETGMDAVTEFRAIPPADLPAGAYTVDWRGLASDGHPMQGTFGFTITN